MSQSNDAECISSAYLPRLERQTRPDNTDQETDGEVMFKPTNSHHDRALLANALRKRGHSIKSDLTKTYRTAKCTTM